MRWEVLKAFVRMVLTFVMGVLLFRLAILGLAHFSGEPESLGSLFSGELFDSLTLPDWIANVQRIFATTLMVAVAFVWSGALSVLIGYHVSKRPYFRFWEIPSFLAVILSGLPIFVVGLALWSILRPDSTMTTSHANAGVKLLLGGVVLGSCEGALGEWPRSIRALLSGLQNDTFYLAARARGQSTAGIVFRAIQSYLVQTIPTRLSYLFGGVIIVEYAIGYEACGYRLMSRLVEGQSVRLYGYRDVMVAGMLIMLVPLLLRFGFACLCAVARRTPMADEGRGYRG